MLVSREAARAFANSGSSISFESPGIVIGSSLLPVESDEMKLEIEIREGGVVRAKIR